MFKNHITPTWGNIQISQHKSFEYQIEFDNFNGHPFEIHFSWTRFRDHAGIDFTFAIYKLFWLNLNIHDHRHWDDDKNDWEGPGDCDYENSKWVTPKE